MNVKNLFDLNNRTIIITGAAGNLATEDLAFMLNDAGYETGISINKVREAVLIAEGYTGQKLGGRISQWWISQERKKAASVASAAE